MNVPRHIVLKGDVFDTKTTKEYLENIVCTDLANIIMSYCVLSHRWTYKRTKKVSTTNNTSRVVFDNNIIKIINSDITKFDTHGNININIKSKYRAYIDIPYIYIMHNNKFIVIHYYNKTIGEIVVERKSEKIIIDDIVKKVAHIRNGIIYTHDLNKSQLDEIILIENNTSRKHSIRNINLYINSFSKKICTQLDKHDILSSRTPIVSLFVNKNNEITIASYPTDDKMSGISKIKLDDGIDAWHISFTDIRILFSDDYEIIFTRADRGDDYSLVSFNKSSGKIYEYILHKIYCLKVDTNTMFFAALGSNNIYIYKLETYKSFL